jgi:hypothetical protein
MARVAYKKNQLLVFGALKLKMLVCTSILWQIGIFFVAILSQFCGHLLYVMFPFWSVVPRKIWQP